MLEQISEILGWTSVAFYIGITIFNSMKFTRYAAFGSAGNDIVWSILMQWWPKLILNLSVAAINTYRYTKDFTRASKLMLNILAVSMGGVICFVFYYAVMQFIAEPSIALAFQFLDLGIIVIALSMKSLKNYRILMLISGFVGMIGYWESEQAIIIKSMVIGIMLFKLFAPGQEEKGQEELKVASNEA
uniref:hypothetical protein n=1 Tax=Thaumasiovibrio occultus TaxID=1891184 RepID=UPI000B35E1A6|nr:hypothetical protein [Thaumasiovibrio occultus]